METKFLTIEEVAQLLRVSESTVRKLVESGELQSTKVGRQYRISEASLQDYIRRHS